MSNAKPIFRKTLHLVVASIISVSCFSQATFVYEPYFPAIVVKDLDVSVVWYKSLFGLKVKTESTDILAGYKVPRFWNLKT